MHKWAVPFDFVNPTLTYVVRSFSLLKCQFLEQALNSLSHPNGGHALWNSNPDRLVLSGLQVYIALYANK